MVLRFCVRIKRKCLIILNSVSEFHLKYYFHFSPPFFCWHQLLPSFFLHRIRLDFKFTRIGYHVSNSQMKGKMEPVIAQVHRAMSYAHSTHFTIPHRANDAVSRDMNMNNNKNKKKEKKNNILLANPTANCERWALPLLPPIVSNNKTNTTAAAAAARVQWQRRRTGKK